MTRSVRPSPLKSGRRMAEEEPLFWMNGLLALVCARKSVKTVVLAPRPSSLLKFTLIVSGALSGTEMRSSRPSPSTSATVHEVLGVLLEMLLTPGCTTVVRKPLAPPRSTRQVPVDQSISKSHLPSPVHSNGIALEGLV